MRIFNRNIKSVTLLDEKWNVIDDNVKFDNLPRIYELIIIELHTDDYGLIEKK